MQKIIEDTAFYNVKDIQKILGIGRNRAYEYLRKVEKEGRPFKVIKIGSLYKVPILSFDNWMNEISK